MSLTVDYYFSPGSPWAYLGHERLGEIARSAGAQINVLPVDLGGRVFPVTGGLPLQKRAPQRQAYRLVDLKRYADHLNQPINVQPQYFPVAADDAAQLVVAVEMHDGPKAAFDVAGAVLRAVWVDQRNIADVNELARIIDTCGLPARRVEDAFSQAVHERYEADSAQAIANGVFGAPTYVIDGELFWGQDRLDFVARRLARAS